MGNHVFGCDICQDVCPLEPARADFNDPQFQPRVFPSGEEKRPRDGSAASRRIALPSKDWNGFSDFPKQRFANCFRGSPVKRTKWRGLMRNACIALGEFRLAARNDGL